MHIQMDLWIVQKGLFRAEKLAKSTLISKKENSIFNIIWEIRKQKKLILLGKAQITTIIIF